jgi:beta-glucosidase
MKRIHRLILVLLIGSSMSSSAQLVNGSNAKMKAFIDGLMKKMTLEEKIGQLNLPGSGVQISGKKFAREKWAASSI